MMHTDPHLICMVVPYFDRIGGYELQAFSLCQTFRRFEKKAFILTTQTSGKPLFERRNHIDIFRIPECFQTYRLLRMYLKALFFWKLKRRPTLFHCHTLSFFTEKILHIVNGFKIPSLVKIATQGDITRLHQEIIADKVNYRKREQIYLQVNAFISINPVIKQELVDLKVDPLNIFSIPNGVDTVRFQPLSPEEKRKIKEKLGLDDQTTFITYVGRFEERKRVVDLIQAWGSIEKFYPCTHLLLVGDGEEKKAYEQKCQELNIQKRVTFTGLITNVEQFMQCSDLFVFPSRLEGLPNVVLEAMACALPMITTDIPGIREVIDHQKTGLLFPSQDIKALIQALQYLLQNRERAKQMGIAARNKVLTQYSFDQITPKFFNLYDSLSKHQ